MTVPECNPHDPCYSTIHLEDKGNPLAPFIEYREAELWRFICHSLILKDPYFTHLQVFLIDPKLQWGRGRAFILQLALRLQPPEKKGFANAHYVYNHVQVLKINVCGF